MRVLVVHASRHGSTSEVAERVAGRMRALGHDVELRPARERGPVAGFELVVVGGSLYSGRWNTDARRFLRKHRDVLAGTSVAVFGMGPRRDEPEAWASSRGQLDRALAKPNWLRPVAVTVFGGRDPKPKRGVVRDIRDWPTIDAWAAELVSEDPPTS